jgi:mRNA-degrading endonuclease RelE of RelBE toxin-antitoxin system
LIVLFSKLFSKDLQKITDASLKKELIQVIVDFENAENLNGFSNIKKMRGFSEAYRLRIGKYRLGFYYDGEVLSLGRFAKRDDIYKLFP